MALRKAFIEGDVMIKYMAALAKGRTAPPFSEFVADICLKRREYGKTIPNYYSAIMQEPLNFVLWYNVSRAHLAQNDVKFSIAACLAGVRDYPTSPSPALVLCCLYTINYDYYNAIRHSISFHCSVKA